MLSAVARDFLKFSALSVNSMKIRIQDAAVVVPPCLSDGYPYVRILKLRLSSVPSYAWNAARKANCTRPGTTECREG